MEYIVIDKWSIRNTLGITRRYNKEDSQHLFYVAWEDGGISHPWLSYENIENRYKIVAELSTTEDVQKTLLAWKLQGKRVRYAQY